MKTHKLENQNLNDNGTRQALVAGKMGSMLKDNRPDSITQAKFDNQVRVNSPQLTSRQHLVDNRPIQKKANSTGLPDKLKAGVENLSGHSLDDVEVHYNSSKPAQLQALAYAQGNQIHLAPGQEKHLPHEAWHVAQQKQGRVKPTMQMKGSGINDDQALETEADVMGNKASQLGVISSPDIFQAKRTEINVSLNNTSTIQRLFWAAADDGTMNWREEAPDDAWTNSGETRNADGHEGPVYYAAGGLRATVNEAKQGIGEGEAILGEADNLQLACWNWALTGFDGQPAVFPQHVFSYAKRGENGNYDEVKTADVWITANIPVAEGREWMLANHGNLDTIIETYYESDGGLAAATMIANRAITRQIIEANGFVVSDAVTPYQICMHYKLTDGVTFDHWWIKVDELVAETFPGTLDENGEVKAGGVLDIQLTHGEQDHAEKGIIRFYVTQLKQVQQDHLISTINTHFHPDDH